MQKILLNARSMTKKGTLTISSDKEKVSEKVKSQKKKIGGPYKVPKYFDSPEGQAYLASVKISSVAGSYMNFEVPGDIPPIVNQNIQVYFFIVNYADRN